MVETYSSELCDELRRRMESQIEFQKSVLDRTHLWLKDIMLWKELNQFSELGAFDRGFVENELAIWLNYTTDDETNTKIEERLVRIPFEQAYCYKNPDFLTKSREEILKCVFVDSVEWRSNPGFARNLSIQEKLRIIKRFEYMCYYVINTREELLFDIQDFLTRNEPSVNGTNLR